MNPINTQHGFSLWKLLPWLVVIALAAILVWIAQNPTRHGDQLQSYLPPALQINPQSAPQVQLEAPPSNNQPTTWQPAISTDNTNPDTPAPISSYHNAVSKAAKSVVNIYTTQKVQNPYANDPVLGQFFEQYRQGQGDTNSLGSGVIVSPDGYIVTNAHVIEQADEITVAFHDGRKSRATIVGSDPDSDLAVIKVELNNLTPLAFRAQPIKVGDVALAIGNPFGVGQTVTQGIISATGRAGLGVSTFEDFIQTDAAINPGNSGGALVDANGALVGINTVIYSRSGGSMGIGFAIPTSIVEQVMNGLIANGKVSRGWLGVALAPNYDNPADLSEKTGVVIASVMPDGPAAKAGLQANDIILSIDGTTTKDPNTLIGIVAKKAPNSTLSTVISRDGKQHTLDVVVSERPSTQKTNEQPTRQLSSEEARILEQLLRQMHQR